MNWFDGVFAPSLARLPARHRLSHHPFPHPLLQRFTFASASPDNIKQWYLPEGKFIQNLTGHNSIINSLAISPDGILVSGADNGTLNFWDYKTGHRFQGKETTPQPGTDRGRAEIQWRPAFMATWPHAACVFPPHRFAGFGGGHLWHGI